MFVLQTDYQYIDNSFIEEQPFNEHVNPWKRRAIIYMTLINCGKDCHYVILSVFIPCEKKIHNTSEVTITITFFLGVFVALSALSMWHGRLISKGETSIEANINKTETVKFQQSGRNYVNPYDFGWKRNWRIFLGLEQKRLEPAIDLLLYYESKTYNLQCEGETFMLFKNCQLVCN